jgi:hypothetical protein
MEQAMSENSQMPWVSGLGMTVTPGTDTGSTHEILRCTTTSVQHFPAILFTIISIYAHHDERAQQEHKDLQARSLVS